MKNKEYKNSILLHFVYSHTIHSVQSYSTNKDKKENFFFFLFKSWDKFYKGIERWYIAGQLYSQLFVGWNQHVWRVRFPVFDFINIYKYIIYIFIYLVSSEVRISAVSEAKTWPLPLSKMSAISC